MTEIRYLTFDERKQIEKLLKTKTSISEIGKILGRHSTCISKEIRRFKNNVKGNYSANLAQQSFEFNIKKRHKNFTANKEEKICTTTIKASDLIKKIEALEIHINLIYELLEEIKREKK